MRPPCTFHPVRKAARFALLTAVLFCSGAVLAQGRGHFSGFGSLAYSHDDGRDIGFMRDTTQPVPPGRDHSWRSDSILGLQAGYRFSPALEVVSQVVLRHRAEYSPRDLVEWAFVAWHPSESLDLRAGRVGVDTFLLSDYRNVGYAQTWIRPPREFYGWIPLGSVDGVDAAWKFDAAGMRWTAKTQFGRSSTELPLTEDDSFRFRFDRLSTLSLMAENADWQFKLGHSAFRVGSQPAFGQVTRGLDAIAAGPFGAISTEAASLRRDTWLKGARVRYLSLGAAYDDGRWQVQGELARVRSSSRMISSGSAAYVSAGYRFGALTPYVVLARFRPQRDARERQTDWSGLGPDAVALQTAAVAAFNNFRIDQRTVSLGTRWDFSDRAALKLQWDRSSMRPRGYGLWQVDNLVSGDRKRRVDVLSVSLDFMF